jgi:hypothetical protein
LLAPVRWNLIIMYEEHVADNVLAPTIANLERLAARNV